MSNSLSDWPKKAMRNQVSSRTGAEVILKLITLHETSQNSHLTDAQGQRVCVSLSWWKTPFNIKLTGQENPAREGSFLPSLWSSGRHHCGEPQAEFGDPPTHTLPGSLAALPSGRYQCYLTEQDTCTGSLLINYSKKASLPQFHRRSGPNNCPLSCCGVPAALPPTPPLGLRQPEISPDTGKPRDTRVAHGWKPRLL